MTKIKEKKNLYRWMSFAESEKELLEKYLNDYGQQGYEIRHIARYYLRFKKSQISVPHYYVQSYRKNYFGHLYWRFSTTPFPPLKSYGSRFKYHLGVLILLGLLLFGSLFFLINFDERLLYTDGLLVLALTFPFFTLSFFLDFLGRFWESYHYHKQQSHQLNYAKYRALFLGLNMLLRYVILFVVVLPLFLKSLRLPVVFVMLSIAIYELASYYLPHRYQKFWIILAGGVSLMLCLLLNQLQDQQLYKKDKINYDEITMMRLENLLDETQFDQNQNYVRHVHRYTSTSQAIPFYYWRKESINMLHQENLHEVISSISVCQDDKISQMVLAGILKRNPSLTKAEDFAFEEVYFSSDRLVVRKGKTIYFYRGTFALQDEKTQRFIFDFLSQDLEKALGS